KDIVSLILERIIPGPLEPIRVFQEIVVPVAIRKLSSVVTNLVTNVHRPFSAASRKVDGNRRIVFEQASHFAHPVTFGKKQSRPEGGRTRCIAPRLSCPGDMAVKTA